MLVPTFIRMKRGGYRYCEFIKKLFKLSLAINYFSFLSVNAVKINFFRKLQPNFCFAKIRLFVYFVFVRYIIDTDKFFIDLLKRKEWENRRIYVEFSD